MEYKANQGGIVSNPYKPQAYKTVEEEFISFGGKSKYLQYLKTGLLRHIMLKKKFKKSIFKKISREAQSLKYLLSEVGVDMALKPPTPPKPPKTPAKQVAPEKRKHHEFWLTGNPMAVLLENLHGISKSDNPQWYLEQYGDLLHKYRIPVEYGRNVLNVPSGKHEWGKGRLVAKPELYFLVPGLVLYTELKCGSPNWDWVSRWLEEEMGVGILKVSGWWKDNVGSLTRRKFSKLLKPLQDAITGSVLVYPRACGRSGHAHLKEYSALVLKRLPWLPSNLIVQDAKWLSDLPKGEKPQSSRI